jgi:subtilisin-like proprotein convertase family protein
MKRNLGLALVALILMALSFLLLPTSMAKRNENSRRDRLQSGATTAKLPANFNGFRSPAQAQPGAPVSMEAVGFAESIPVRDMVSSRGRMTKQRQRRAEQEDEVAEGKETEKNEKNREIIRRFDASLRTPDQALSSDNPFTRELTRSGITPKVLPTPSVNFDGISFADTTAVGQGFTPPDTNGEVGPNHFVQTVNSSFRIWNKTGTALSAVTTFPTLFAGLGSPCGNSDDGDPIVNYDQLADRWLISELCYPTGDPSVGPFYQIFAVSKTGDPTGAYYLYRFLSPGTDIFPDYPHVGVWPDAYYMTTNQFSPTDFVGAGVYAFNRAKMLVGDPTANVVYFDKSEGCPADCTFGGMQPSDLDGFALPPADAPNAFAMFDANESGGTHIDSLIIYDFHVDFATPANSTFTQRTGSPLPVAAFDPTAATDIPQPGGTPLDAITDRLMFRLSYRNLGTKETLTVNHTVNASGNATFRAGGRVYQLSKATPAAAFGIDEQTTWAPADTEHRWMGSAAQNYLGDIAYGFSVSSATVFPSVRYAAHLATDAPGSGLAQGEQTMIAGTSSQTSGTGRWGDYSDLTIDPNDDCTFWYTQEYMGGGTTWKTRIGAFNVRATPCTTSQRGSINGTITNCQTGLPIPNAFVSFSGGFSRATGAAGTYSAIVTPGTYNGSATGTGYDTASTTGLVVSNGGSATFNACLNGTLKQPVADTASVTADSCNSNGTIDPNETVTVSFGIKNTGTLNTVNLVATLQATGGVTSPSAPQTYGVVVAGGATVFRNFTFTAANLACGAPLTATLQLQDGATNLGTITYNFNTGVELLALNENFDSVVAPALPAGWVAANAVGAVPLWVTSTTDPDTAPNDAFVDNPATTSDKLLDTPGIAITSSSAQVSFRNNYNLEDGFDGGVLEVSSPNINAGTFTDITNAAVGGSFVTGGYNDTISASFGSPIGGRQAWTGSSSGYINTVANLGPNVVGQTIKLRFRMASDVSFNATGWRVDTVKVSNGYVCCGPQINAAPPAVITAESISPANNAADPEETVTVNLALLNVGGPPTTNLVATLQPTGGVAGPSGPQNYGIIAGSGGTATRPFTFTAQGTCGSNITLTLALQDGALNLGTVAFTLQLGTTTPSAPTPFSNPTAITIPATGSGVISGSPYPSAISVSGMTGTTSKVTVTLTNMSHAFASDMDLLLVSPTGQKFIIVSDTIRNGAVTNATYTLDDAAATLLPSSGPPASGTYRPSNVSTGDTFPATAPAGPYLSPVPAGADTFASAFNGANPNGTWNLYVADDFGSLDGGSIAGGWSITITTAVPACNSQACTITAPISIVIPPGTCGTVINYSPPVTFTGACGVVVGPDPPTGSFFGIGTRTVLVKGTRADASVTDKSFPVTVQDSETQTTGLGPSVTNNYCNTTVNYAAVTFAGSTTVVDAPAQVLPPPFVHCASCPELRITTTATFTPPVTTCITLPVGIDFNTFSRLRILHGEPVALVNRTISSNAGTRTICARTTTVSPFVVALDPNAPTAAPATISGRITTSDGAPLAGVSMNLSGARTAKVISDSNGNYRFQNVDTDNFYTVTPTLRNYHFAPASQSFSLAANNVDAVFTATRDAVISGNAIDTADYFVRQHYLDFLGREPDESGFNFWSDQILSCGADAGCRERRTINVSAAYFLSIEFQQTGGLVDGLYRASYNRRPLYNEFMPDTATVARDVIVGSTTDWPGILEANKQAFVAAWVERAAFQSAYGGLSNDGYVDTLISHTGVSFSQGERNKLVSGLSNGTLTRANVLRQIAENDRFVSAKRNGTFVMMEYFGYLRRDPDESGYQFWLNKLSEFNGDFERAEMVKAFIVSGEYRQRFRL